MRVCSGEPWDNSVFWQLMLSLVNGEDAAPEPAEMSTADVEVRLGGRGEQGKA